MRDVSLAVLAGSGLAGVLSENVGLVFVMLTIIFIASLNMLKTGEQRRTEWRKR
jgi:hypothetical protein